MDHVTKKLTHVKMVVSVYQQTMPRNSYVAVQKDGLDQLVLIVSVRIDFSFLNIQ